MVLMPKIIFVILLLQPESFRVLLSCANQGVCYLILAGITKFKYERKNVKDSGHTSKMTPSCKWPIRRGFGKNNSVLAGVPMSSFSCSLARLNSSFPPPSPFNSCNTGCCHPCFSNINNDIYVNSQSDMFSKDSMDRVHKGVTMPVHKNDTHNDVEVFNNQPFDSSCRR